MFAVVVRGKVYVSNVMTDFLAHAIINDTAYAFYTTGVAAAEATAKYYADTGYGYPINNELVDWAQRVIDTQNWRLP